MSWKGLPPEENEWLTASKLQNAADVVQDYLTELSDRGRPAARVGKPDSAAVQRGSQSAVSDSADNAGAVVPARGRGRPRKSGRIAKQPKHSRGRPRKQFCNL